MLKRFMKFIDLVEAIDALPIGTIIKANDDTVYRLHDVTVSGVPSRAFCDEHRTIIQYIDPNKIFEIVNFSFEGDVGNGESTSNTISNFL